MSQKTNIENLNSILETVNSLPDAGSGGGSIETCTLSVDWWLLAECDPDNLPIAYIQCFEDGEIKTNSFEYTIGGKPQGAPNTFIVPKNAIVALKVSDVMYPELCIMHDGTNVVTLFAHPEYGLAYTVCITGDANIEIGYP